MGLTAYDPASKFAADFQTKPWYQVLQEPGIKLGRYDPNRDPLGYYTLFVARLAERYYGIPGLKQQILGADNNPNDSPEGTALFSQFGFPPSPIPPSPILAGGNINAIPLPLRCQVRGTYHNP